MHPWLRFLAQAASCALLVLATGSAGARTVTLDAARFPDPALVDGVSLPMNGAGIRTRLMFKVYAAALYAQTRFDSTEAFHKMPGPKRIHVIMLRDVPGDELGKLFTRGLEANMDRASFARVIPGILKASELLSECRTLKAGTGFSMDWVPSRGAVLTAPCTQRVEVIKEHEAFTALLNIWLGAKPADQDLKARLLGTAPESARNLGPASGESAN